MSEKTALDVLVDFAPGDDTSPIAKEARAELDALRETAEALKDIYEYAKDNGLDSCGCAGADMSVGILTNSGPCAMCRAAAALQGGG